MFTVRASIDAWRGSVQDLSTAAASTIEAIAESTGEDVETRVRFGDGKQQQYTDLSEFEQAALAVPPEDLSSIRTELDAPRASVTASVVARREFPGIQVEATAPDRIRVDGLAYLLYGTLMRGYVDALPNIWRPLVWFSSLGVPIVLISVLFGDWFEELSVGERIPIGLALLVVSVLLFFKTFDWVKWKIPLEFVPDTAEARVPLIEQYQRVRGNRWVAGGLAVIGALLLAIIGNKLSDLIPWR